MKRGGPQVSNLLNQDLHMGGCDSLPDPTTSMRPYSGAPQTSRMLELTRINKLPGEHVAYTPAKKQVFFQLQKRLFTFLTVDWTTELTY